MTARRPRRYKCLLCGDMVHLGWCGVDEHLHTKRTKREQIEQCNGYVYIHESTGGMDGCPPEKQ